MNLRGYKLVAALYAEADVIACDERANLVRNAAREIERLLSELREANLPEVFKTKTP